jgi:Transposase DDE domain
MRTIISSTEFGIIMDVKATRAIRQAEVSAAKTMIERTQERFEIKPAYLAADTAYGSADTLNWIVNEKKIAPHIPVIDKSKREDGTFSREDFRFRPRTEHLYLPSQQSAHHHRPYRPRPRAPLPGVTA